MTKPIKVVSWRERIKRLTVWHPINTDPTDDDRWTVRVWLPLYDVLAVTGGLIAFWVGSPMLNTLFPEWVVDLAAIAFATAGAVTLVGVVVPKLWIVEVLGKIAMSFLLTSYAFLVMAFPSREPYNNSFVTVILIMATWGVYPRLTKLFIRGYKDAAAQRAEKTGQEVDR